MRLWPGLVGEVEPQLLSDILLPLPSVPSFLCARGRWWQYLLHKRSCASVLPCEPGSDPDHAAPDVECADDAVHRAVRSGCSFLPVLLCVYHWCGSTVRR